MLDGSNLADVRGTTGRPGCIENSSLRYLLLIPCAYLVVGATYVQQTPPFETPDEYGHYAYVRYLYEERRLPPLFVSSHEWEQGQMHQPPLYYGLGALLVGPLDTDAWQQAHPRNEFAALGQPHTLGNRNAVLHPATPTIETLRTANALRVSRALSCLWHRNGLPYLLSGADASPTQRRSGPRRCSHAGLQSSVLV